MSGENKWTPGPWVAQSTHPTPNKLDQLVMNAVGTHVGWAYRNEDAHLISAAPELFKELERLVDAFESEIRSSYEGTSSLEVRLSETGAARAALAKARGESQ